MASEIDAEDAVECARRRVDLALATPIGAKPGTPLHEAEIALDKALWICKELLEDKDNG